MEFVQSIVVSFADNDVQEESVEDASNYDNETESIESAGDHPTAIPHLKRTADYISTQKKCVRIYFERFKRMFVLTKKEVFGRSRLIHSSIENMSWSA